MLENQESYN